MDKIKEYLKWKGLTTKAACSRYRVWLYRLNQHMEDDGKVLKDVTMEDIVDFSEWVLSNFAPKTHQFCMSVIQNFLAYCNANDPSTLSPKMVKVRKVKAKSHPPVTEEQYRKMLAHYPTNEYKHLQKHLLLRMLWETGGRISEVLSIDINDLDLDNAGAMVDTRKTLNKRKLYWSAETNRLLKVYLPIRMEIRRSDALFIGLKNNREYSDRLTSRSVQRMLRKLREIIGTEEAITPHSFRHSKAHSMLNNGATVADIANLLGHTNPASSFHYLQFSDLELKQKAKLYL